MLNESAFETNADYNIRSDTRDACCSLFNEMNMRIRKSRKRNTKHRAPATHMCRYLFNISY